MADISVDEYRRYELLQAEHHHEQAHFWSRFASFSTLTAALFVVVTTTGVRDTLAGLTFVVLVGVGLCYLWSRVQELSLKYVNRWKPLYHAERKRLQFDHATTELEQGPSSTKLACYIPSAAAWLWLALFVLSLPSF